MKIILLILTVASILMAQASRSVEFVIDTTTGLIWQDNNDTKTVSKTWSEAIDYCENLRLEDHSDWRLPNKKEILSIVDRSRYSPALDTDVFQHYSMSRYWSSTTYARDTSKGWNVHFGYGYSGDNVKSDSNNVRCVRGGQFNHINHAPDALDDSYSIGFEETLTGNVLTNDSDQDGDSLSVTHYVHTSHGTLSVDVNGSFTYLPTAGYSGTDSFTYGISDGQGGVDTATVNITVELQENCPSEQAVKCALLREGSYAITGTFGKYDFNQDGDESDMYDWGFTLLSNGITYALRGKNSSAQDVFGWKSTNISGPTAQWYMFSLGADVDGDGNRQFD